MIGVVEIPFDLKVRNKEGKILIERFSKEFEVPCRRYVEECHGFQEFIECDEEVVEKVLRDYLENIELEEAAQYFFDYDYISDISDIVEVIK